MGVGLVGRDLEGSGHRLRFVGNRAVASAVVWVLITFVCALAWTWSPSQRVFVGRLTAYGRIYTPTFLHVLAKEEGNTLRFVFSTDAERAAGGTVAEVGWRFWPVRVGIWMPHRVEWDAGQAIRISHMRPPPIRVSDAVILGGFADFLEDQRQGYGWNMKEIDDWVRLLRSGERTKTEWIWFGVFFDAMMVGFSGWVVWFVYSWFRVARSSELAKKRWVEGVCPMCEYPLGGHVEHGCPECGWGMGCNGEWDARACKFQSVCEDCTGAESADGAVGEGVWRECCGIGGGGVAVGVGVSRE